MGTANLDCQKKLTSNQISNNDTSNEVYKLHLLASPNGNDIVSMHRTQVTKKMMI
jgi:hypothetical protein